MAGFWAAIGFLTRLPMPATPYNDETVRASLRWYPLVGLLVGALVALAAMGLQCLFPQAGLLVAVGTITCWVGLTGALHLDGLADTLDAWVGGLGDRERTLAIMKDPHVGSTAVVWLSLFLMAKVAAVMALLDTPYGCSGLLLACAWARLSPLWLFQLTPYVRAQGLGTAMQNALSRSQCLSLSFGVILIALLLLPVWMTLLLTLTSAVLFLLCRHWMLTRLGGMTGDTAGALIELTELVFLLTLLAAAQ